MKHFDPIAFHFLGLEIHWYALIIVTGVILAVVLATREGERVGIKADDVTDFMLYGLPIGIIGARIYYVLFEWPYYAANPGEIIKIWHGGLAIYGGLIAGAITLVIFCRHRFISVWKFLDIAAPGIILAQAIGRWGNFMNHEAFGPKTTRAFLEQFHLPQWLIDNMYIEGFYRQPTFLYESSWNLLGFLLLILLRRVPHFFRQGEIFLAYLMWYSVGRFFIEGLRTDSLYLFSNIRISQLLSVILFAGALLVILYRRHKKVPYYERNAKSGQK
ncbi:MAG: prolipoprotein diacylglyceryl transferase [Enterococcaceae bacterium]|jgi:phosphatidylglycerol:prolipoprotein diacylglycerol transferase|nr:prolipoprotein diacylglyceryl transferase [Enterococcaceae bacterium]MCI1918714.1 prolipoprotein diacylglyceryl transferase [Enterococcaceae bacterium]